MSRIIEDPITILHGTAVVRISDEALGDVRPSPDFVLAISEPAGRAGTVTFWSGSQTGADATRADNFSGSDWSLLGTGIMVLKARGATGPAGNPLYGVAALWPVIEEAAETFAELAQKNAAASVTQEVGCHAFGVFQAFSAPTVFALVEVFDSADSFGRHLETEHFREFAEYARRKYRGDRTQTLKGAARWV